jgi:hypothetical protein
MSIGASGTPVVTSGGDGVSGDSSVAAACSPFAATTSDKNWSCDFLFPRCPPNNLAGVSKAWQTSLCLPDPAGLPQLHARPVCFRGGFLPKFTKGAVAVVLALELMMGSVLELLECCALRVVLVVARATKMRLDKGAERGSPPACGRMSASCPSTDVTTKRVPDASTLTMSST